MKAAQVTASGEPLQLATTGIPAPGAGEVVVRVRRCGICHTDLHLHDGYFGLGGDKRLALKQALPLTLGHEIQGEVHALGDGASDLELGQSVAVYPWIGCGDCALCNTEREHLCARGRAIGVNVAGGYAEYVRVPDARYVLPIDGVDPQQAALLMCSGLSAFSALSKVQRAFDGGAPVAIIGFGGLGQMALEIARARFGRLPIVIDVAADKLALAKTLGTRGYDMNDESVAKRIRAEHGDIGAVIDFVGAEATSTLAGRLGGQAGHVVIVGLFGGMLKTPLPLLALRGTTIQGSYVGSLAEARAVLGIAAAGELQPIPVSCCGLDDVNAAFRRLRDGQAKGRLMIEINS